MNGAPSPAPLRAGLAVDAVRLFCLDPSGTGLCLRGGRPAHARDALVARLRECLPDGVPYVSVPCHVSDERLLGGLDLAASLAARRPVMARGLLAAADGGVLRIAMAESLDEAMAARITAAMDARAVCPERDGLRAPVETCFGVVAFDEGIGPDEHPPARLLDRLAFRVELDDLRPDELPAWSCDDALVESARARLPAVTVDGESMQALVSVAAACGIASLRACQFAVRTARGLAALAGRNAVSVEDVARAAQLVFAPRATCLPAPQADATQAAPDPERDEAGSPPPESERSTEEGEVALTDLAVAAVAATVPGDLLGDHSSGAVRRSEHVADRRAQGRHKEGTRGRPAGVREFDGRSRARIDVIATLRAAAPWQRLRGRAAGAGVPARCEIRRDDFRQQRLRQIVGNTTVFVVDASGSTALQRLAEAKGAVELLLAQCYVRRDRVALIAFRGTAAELLLPPTRSLVRAKRCLADLRGGGGTPLASAIVCAHALADGVQRRGDATTLVFLTDGRANVGRDGHPGREQAVQDAMSAARALRDLPAGKVVVDTSPRPQACARAMADAMAGRYLPLPFADAARLQSVVRGGVAAGHAGAAGGR